MSSKDRSRQRCPSRTTNFVPSGRRRCTRGCVFAMGVEKTYVFFISCSNQNQNNLELELDSGDERDSPEAADPHPPSL